MWLALAAIAMAVAVGWRARESFAEQQNLPARVQRVEQRVDALEATLDSVRSSTRELRRQQDQMLCLQLAQVQEGPWQECLR